MEYSNFVRSNQILPQKVDFWGKKVPFYSSWRSNQEWPSNRADTVYVCMKEIFLNHFSWKCVLKLRDLRAGHVISYLLTKLPLEWLTTVKSTADKIHN